MAVCYGCFNPRTRQFVDALEVDEIERYVKDTDNRYAKQKRFHFWVKLNVSKFVANALYKKSRVPNETNPDLGIVTFYAWNWEIDLPLYKDDILDPNKETMPFTQVIDVKKFKKVTMTLANFRQRSRLFA